MSEWEVNLAVIVVGGFVLFMAYANPQLPWLWLIGIATLAAGILLWIQDALALRRKKRLVAAAAATAEGQSEGETSR